MTTVASALPPPVPPFTKRARIALGALYALMRDHSRLDQVLILTQALNARAISRGVVRFGETEVAQRFFAEQPRIDRAHVDFEALRRLPDGTLGREYTRFLDDNGITPDAFEALPDVGDERAAWLMLRMRQSHDLWHVLTGYGPDVRGELLLQAFTYAHVRVPGSLVLVVAGSLRWLKLDRAHLTALRTAYRRGKAARPLPTVRWEDHWETPVSELRAMLDCPPLPAS